uniref:Phosphate transporter n=1 Tax=Caenorhabditis japonica TaxID=281687 RepID=A0A8R1DJ67_CAEJA
MNAFPGHYAHQFFTVSTTSSTPLPITSFKPFPYYNLEAVQWSLLFGVCFLLGVGMGGNDVADAFGTSVGTGTVTITQAFLLATIVEMMGSVASGLTGNVGKTLQVIDTDSYADNPDELVIGQIAMLIGCSTWLMIATFYSMPVSSIHSLLGATMGFSFVLRGVHGIVWERVWVVALVWVLSPIASALFTLIIFFLLDVTILRARNPVKTGLLFLPLVYAIVVFTNVLLFLQDGSRKQNTELPRIASSLSYSFPIRPRGWLRKAVYWAFPPMRNDDQKAVRLFSLLQVLTACFAGFAHGANDVTNCVAPIRDLIKMYNQGYQEDNTKLNITVYVGLLSTLAILLGIWTLGIRVIRTVGQDFAKMNPATGFCVEFGAAIVALATNIYSIPQSMTHCIVGSIFGLGLVRSGPILKWNTVKYVFLSWILTIPVSGLISAGVMYIMQTILSQTDF